MQFDLLATDGAARRGRLGFDRGSVETPAFMPVGTYGTVKAMTPDALRALGAEIVLGNTFHLFLRPGTEVIAAHGGLHGFMRWERPDPHRLRRLPGLVAGAAAPDHARAACGSRRRWTVRRCSWARRNRCGSSARWIPTS